MRSEAELVPELAAQPKARIQIMRYVIDEKSVDVPAYWCPVCCHPHAIATKKTGAVHKGWNGATWTYNEDIHKPTFHPSVLTYTTSREGDYWHLKRNGKYLCVPDTDKPLEFHDFAYAQRYAGERAADNDGQGWGVVERHRNGEKRNTICHVHVTNGMIQILPDTPGDLGGKTIPLEAWSWKAYMLHGKKE